MKSNKILGVAVAIALLLSLGALYAALVGGNQSAEFGASGTRFPNGVSADTTSPVAGELRGDDLNLDDDAVITDDFTVNGRSAVITTSNTSTSTLEVGCVQMYATSTATALHLEFNTSSATSTINGQSNGIVAWKYGACPV